MRENSKPLIIETALKLFANVGYDKTSISHIAKAAGISQGLMYNYFRSKEELLKEVIGQGFSQIRETMQFYFEDYPADQVVRLHIEATFKLVEQNKNFWRLFHSVRLQNDVLRQMEGERKKITRYIYYTLYKHFEKMGFENPAYEATILFGTIDGLIAQYLLSEDRFPLREIGQYLIRRYEKVRSREQGAGSRE
jgi:AcrR family transcriptional regulator